MKLPYNTHFQNAIDNLIFLAGRGTEAKELFVKQRIAVHIYYVYLNNHYSSVFYIIFIKIIYLKLSFSSSVVLFLLYFLKVFPNLTATCSTYSTKELSSYMWNDVYRYKIPILRVAVNVLSTVYEHFQNFTYQKIVSMVVFNTEPSESG